MEQLLPDTLRNAVNEDVLNYVQGKSAHSDIGEALINAVKKLGDVQSFRPDPRET